MGGSKKLHIMISSKEKQYHKKRQSAALESISSHKFSLVTKLQRRPTEQGYSSPVHSVIKREFFLQMCLFVEENW